MQTRQDMKADAKESAENAPPVEEGAATEALAEAEARGGTAANGQTRQQPVYKTQTDDIAGENVHRGKDAIISEFDDPAANTVRAGEG